MANVTPKTHALIVAEVVPTHKDVIGIALSDGGMIELPIELWNAANLIHDWFVRKDIEEWSLGPICSRSYLRKFSAQSETLEQIRKLVSPSKKTMKLTNEPCPDEQGEPTKTAEQVHEETVAAGQPIDDVKQFADDLKQLRVKILGLANNVQAIKRSHVMMMNPVKTGVNYEEVAANLQLAYRHLEDARMRLGKSIQAAEGGVSIYD